jgi:1-deoxy-D-xylulose-5-phosphate synthase
LQDLPIVFCLDRAGLTGPDGPTHHGCFDIGYLRIFPNLIVMAPGDEADVAPMLRFAFDHHHPTAIRYPKANLERIPRPFQDIELGKAEVYCWGQDGALIAFGNLFPTCVEAARRLKQEAGLDLAVINARFAKPLDHTTVLRAVQELPFVVTVEEGALHGGFGSAVLEAANDAGLDTRSIVRLGIPDRFIEHGERHELLRDLGLDVDGICSRLRELADFHAERLHRSWSAGRSA